MMLPGRNLPYVFLGYRPVVLIKAENLPTGLGGVEHCLLIMMVWL